VGWTLAHHIQATFDLRLPKNVHKKEIKNDSHPARKRFISPDIL